MRAWILLAFLPALAMADPPRSPEPNVVVVPDPNRLPGATPGTGVVIAPPADFPDARDYPRGMVIRPDYHGDDAFVIAPGKLAETARGVGRYLQDAFGVLRHLFEQH
jgi:hypothetical protein